MEIVESVLREAFSFSQTVVGIVVRPYATYRRLVERAPVGEMGVIGGLIGCYFALVSVMKLALFHPLLLTRQFLLLSVATALGCFLVIEVVWIAGRWLGGKGTLGGIAIAWAYTLIPTFLWFVMTSLLSLLLPPPRTTSFGGILFSLLYLVCSGVLFLWKGTLLFLTVRFGMRLDLVRIAVVIAVLVPFVGVYSVVMYRLGIFKVPFL